MLLTTYLVSKLEVTMSEPKQNINKGTTEFKEFQKDYVKKSLAYPAPPNPENRPIGAEAPQPAVDKKSKD